MDPLYHTTMLLQCYLQSQHFQALRHLLIVLRPVLIANDHDLDMTNYFRCCWQDHWYFSCVVLLEMKHNNLYQVNITEQEFNDFNEDYWNWRHMAMPLD